MNKNILSIAAAAVLALGAVGSVSAATETDTLDVELNVENACTFTVTDIVEDGASGISSSMQSNVTNGLIVLCNLDTAYAIGAGNGEYMGARATHPTHRAVTDGNGNFVPYQLYADGTWSAPWSDTGTISGIGNGEWQTHPYSYEFYALSHAPGGTYTDAVVITLTY